ncbi:MULTISPECIES: hypothetical protein [unclassified Acinetobacter]|uniref:hypothetical protein n=1 Tax=unclassified Acinetobacter TaxID=196816 RepID=UPI00124C4529|nr:MULTISPECIES: hypothetical protein [unclassified Acinetobacter]
MSQFTLEEWLKLVADLKTSQSEFNVGTASPIFHVQEEKKVYGLNAEYSDKECWIDGEEGTEFDSAQHYYDELDAEDKHELNALSLANHSELFCDLDEREKNEALEAFSNHNDLHLNKTHYKTEWFDVGVFLTRQEADWFINRKQHDYGKLRVYVKSLYWAPQHKRLIQAILNGEIKYVVKGGAK